jgi:2-dehydro-3-deoxygalactonokinase
VTPGRAPLPESSPDPHERAQRPAESATALLALDWGTTRARAWCIDASGRIRGSRSAPLGVQQIANADFAAALATLLGDWRDLRVPRIACGMIGSRQGWVEAPYVECPAPFHALAERLVFTPGRELAIVPGLLYRDPRGIPDVMRGEETQIAGAVDEDEDTVLAVLPGTHSKWAHVGRGRVVAFRTYMTGELYAVLLANSILGRLAESSSAEAEPGPAFVDGVERGLADGALGHAIFGARTLALVGDLASRDVADWLSGVLIGQEIGDALRWARGNGLDAARVRVVGADALVTRYSVALARAGAIAEAGPADAAVRGLIRIAGHARLVAR